MCQLALQSLPKRSYDYRWVTRKPEEIVTRNQSLVTTGVGFEPPSDPTPVVSLGALGRFPRRTLLGFSVNRGYLLPSYRQAIGASS